MIRFGICASPDNAETIASIGFDYIECGLSSIAALSIADYRKAKAAVLASGVRAEAFNVMLPGYITLVGEKTDLTPARTYLYLAMQRAYEMGARVVVFGSGRSRVVPDGYSYEKAMDDLAAYLNAAGEICGEYGIDIAIEPLNKAESNIINSVSEGCRLAKLAGHKRVFCLADLYHIAKDGEDMSGIIEAGSMLRHCHIAYPPTRVYPKPGDGYDYGRFFKALKDIGYSHRVSVEASAKDIKAEGALALEALRTFA